MRLLVPHDDSKADRRCRRKLGELAWDRELRAEIHKLADAIREMDAGMLSPHEVNDRIHAFHNGISRDLWVRYTQSDPWIAVYCAYYDGYLTDDDLASATDGVIDGLRKFGELRDTRAQLDSRGEEPDGG